MATEVEKLRKEVASLEAKKSERERKHAEAGQRKAELGSRRQSLLTQIAEGNEGARRELRQIDGEKQEAEENEQAFAAAGANVARQLDAAKKALARTEHEAAITALESQIASLAPLDNEMEAALNQVKQKSEALFSAAKDVGAQLFAMDEHRFDQAFGFKLTASIREAIWHRFEEMGFPNTERRPSFLERATGRLRSAIAQLRYESLVGQVVPERGEHLYRTRWQINGIRNIDLAPGSLIGLTEAEAAEFLAAGSLELVDDSAVAEEAA